MVFRCRNKYRQVTGVNKDQYVTDKAGKKDGITAEIL